MFFVITTYWYDRPTKDKTGEIVVRALKLFVNTEFIPRCPTPVYWMKDMNNETILGTYYLYELRKVKKSADDYLK